MRRHPELKPDTAYIFSFSAFNDMESATSGSAPLRHQLINVSVIATNEDEARQKAKKVVERTHYTLNQIEQQS